MITPPERSLHAPSPTHLANRRAFFYLPQNKRDLRVRELCSLHGIFFLSTPGALLENSNLERSNFQDAGQLVGDVSARYYRPDASRLCARIPSTCLFVQNTVTGVEVHLGSGTVVNLVDYSLSGFKAEWFGL